MAQSQVGEELRQDPVAWRAADAWVRQNGAAYVGQWVALRGGEFLGASRSFLELERQLPSNTDDILFTVIE